MDCGIVVRTANRAMVCLSTKMNTMQKQAWLETAQFFGMIVVILIGCAAVVGGIAWVGMTYGIMYGAAITAALLIAFIIWVVYNDRMWHLQADATQRSIVDLIEEMKKSRDEFYHDIDQLNKAYKDDQRKQQR